MNSPKNKVQYECYSLIPDIANAPHYLVENINGTYHMHRQLERGEFIWYNEEQILEYQKCLYVKNIMVVDSLAAAKDLVEKIWFSTNKKRCLVT